MRSIEDKASGRGTPIDPDDARALIAEALAFVRGRMSALRDRA